MLPGVGSDVQHSVKFIALQLVTQVIPVTLDQSHIGELWLGAPVQNIHIIALLGKVIGNIPADKNRTAGHKEFSHFTISSNAMLYKSSIKI